MITLQNDLGEALGTLASLQLGGALLAIAILSEALTAKAVVLDIAGRAIADGQTPEVNTLVERLAASGARVSGHDKRLAFTRKQIGSRAHIPQRLPVPLDNDLVKGSSLAPFLAITPIAVKRKTLVPLLAIVVDPSLVRLDDDAMEREL